MLVQSDAYKNIINRHGCVLQEFVMGLSVLSRGTLQERLQWAFNLYDINGDGFITKDEMTDIVSAIYEMMGRFSEPMIDENTAKEHVDRVFLVSLWLFLDLYYKDQYRC